MITGLLRNRRRIFDDAVFYAVLFGANNVASYFFIVIAGRELAASQFGVFSALLGLITMSGVFATGFQVATTQTIAAYAHRSALVDLLRHVFRVMLPVTFILTLLLLPFAPRIGATVTQIALCGIIAFVTFLATAALGFLGGFGMVRAQAGVNLAGAAVRLATGWPLIVLGFGVGGALAGYLANYIVVFALAFIVSMQIAGRPLPESPIPAAANSHQRLRWGTVATYVLAVAPYCLDQTMVQLFNPALGGDYAALAAVSKLVFLATYPITAVVYPYAIGRSDAAARLQVFTLGAVALISAVILLVFALYLFPDQAIRLFFGARFQHVAPYLGFLALGVAFLAVSVLIAQALIVSGNPFGFLPSLLALGAGVTLYAIRHDSFADIVSDQVWMCAIQLALILLVCAPRLRRSLAPTAAT